METPKVTPHHPIYEHKRNVTKRICSLRYLEISISKRHLKYQWSLRVTASVWRNGKCIFKQERWIFNLQFLSISSDSAWTRESENSAERCGQQKSSHWGCKMLHHQIQCVCAGEAVHTRARRAELQRLLLIGWKQQVLSAHLLLPGNYKAPQVNIPADDNLKSTSHSDALQPTGNAREYSVPGPDPSCPTRKSSRPNL